MADNKIEKYTLQGILKRNGAEHHLRIGNSPVAKTVNVWNQKGTKEPATLEFDEKSRFIGLRLKDETLSVEEKSETPFDVTVTVENYGTGSIAYVYFPEAGKAVRTILSSDRNGAEYGVHLDVDEDRNVIGVEIMNGSQAPAKT